MSAHFYLQVGLLDVPEHGTLGAVLHVAHLTLVLDVVVDGVLVPDQHPLLGEPH